VSRRLKEAGYPALTRAKLARLVQGRRKERADRRRLRAEAERAAEAGDEASGPARYAACSAACPSPPEGGEPARFGIIDREGGRRLTNFELSVEEELEVVDDVQPQSLFVARLRSAGRQEVFRIPAADYANNARLQAALYAAGGPGLEVHCRMEELRNAVAA